jgi:hypothetical protein
MPFQTWIADQLRAFGLPVEEYAGWTTRGSSSFSPGGALAHWTAGPCRATGRPSLNTVVNGRADLPGPLANVYLDRAGVSVVVAAGRANHAGSGGWRGLAGNSSVLGVEAECCNAGDWTQAQFDVYPVLLGALVAGCAAAAAMVCRHCDWAPGRKIDTNDLALSWLQDGAAAAIAAAGGTTTTLEEVPMFFRGPDNLTYFVSGSLVAGVANSKDLAELQKAAANPSYVAVVSKDTQQQLLAGSTSRSE